MFLTLHLLLFDLSWYHLLWVTTLGPILTYWDYLNHHHHPFCLLYHPHLWCAIGPTTFIGLNIDSISMPPPPFLRPLLFYLVLLYFVKAHTLLIIVFIIIKLWVITSCLHPHYTCLSSLSFQFPKLQLMS